jgi:hypothetical protein
VFDPTPPSERGARANVPLAAPDATAPADADAPAVWWRTASAALRAVAATPWPWLGVLLLPLLLAVRGARARTSGPPPLQPLLRPARRQLLQILRALAVRGYPRPPGTTLEAHTDGLLQLGACPPDLRAAFAAYQEVRFGGRPWDSERRQRLAAGLLAAELLPSLRPAPQ